MENTISPLKVFISYTHKDKQYKENLVSHLSALIRQKYITLWYDNMILPGTEIDEEVMRALGESQIILLLISADYLSSHYCYDIEMVKAMELRQETGAAVIPVMLRPADLAGTPFERLNTLPEDRQAVSLFKNEDEAYENVAKGIRRVAESWYKRPDGKGTAAPKKAASGAGNAAAGPGIESRHTNYGIELNGSVFNGSCVINNHIK